MIRTSKQRWRQGAQTRAVNWLLALALAAACAVLGPWLDGQPSDTEAEGAAAANLRDAQAAARQQQHLAHAEVALRTAQQDKP